ncbi:hypothetical protein FKM82_018156 [Ascaphus truei]
MNMLKHPSPPRELDVPDPVDETAEQELLEDDNTEEQYIEAPVTEEDNDPLQPGQGDNPYIKFLTCTYCFILDAFCCFSIIAGLLLLCC